LPENDHDVPKSDQFEPISKSSAEGEYDVQLNANGSLILSSSSGDDVQAKAGFIARATTPTTKTKG